MDVQKIKLPNNEEIKDRAYRTDSTEDYSEAPIFIDAATWIRNIALQREVEYQQDIAMRDEYEKALEEYINLIGDSESNLAGFAFTHGIKVDKKIVAKGKELRQKINELKDQIK